MPYREDAPDVVLPCRPGENRELRYALRSLEKHFDYRHIWIVGSWPKWLDTTTEHLTAVRRPTLTPKYKTTRAHYRWACESDEVTDPWVMWNDDFYCLQPTPTLSAIHRGRCSEVTPRFESWTSKWAIGMRKTEELMRRIMPGVTLYNYDIHTPILVWKKPMIRALALAEGMGIQAPHVRTLYGNLAGLGGTAMHDPKAWNRREAERWDVWLSSHESTFRKCVEPRLRLLGLTRPCAFELHGITDRTDNRNPGMRDQYGKRKMKDRVIKTEKGWRAVRQPQNEPLVTSKTRNRRRQLPTTEQAWAHRRRRQKATAA